MATTPTSTLIKTQTSGTEKELYSPATASIIGVINSIVITNTHSSAVEVTLDVYDGTNSFVILKDFSLEPDETYTYDGVLVVKVDTESLRLLQSSGTNDIITVVTSIVEVT